MNIGQASASSGVSAKMIRYYQGVGLLSDNKRNQNGYRAFDENDVHRLRFVRRSRDFGFSVAQISKLLGLWQGKKPSSDVKKLALAHVAELDQKIEHLQELRNTLNHLADCCQGDHLPDCPIIESLSGATVAIKLER